MTTRKRELVTSSTPSRRATTLTMAMAMVMPVTVSRVAGGVRESRSGRASVATGTHLAWRPRAAGAFASFALLSPRFSQSLVGRSQVLSERTYSLG